MKAKMIAVTTTSAQVLKSLRLRFVTDDATGQKYPLADYALTPDMAIVDANPGYGHAEVPVVLSVVWTQ
ncbi:hypothetical protein ACP0HM_03500 [Escherichia coli]